MKPKLKKIVTGLSLAGVLTFGLAGVAGAADNCNDLAIGLSSCCSSSLPSATCFAPVLQCLLSTQSCHQARVVESRLKAG